MAQATGNEQGHAVNALVRRGIRSVRDAERLLAVIGDSCVLALPSAGRGPAALAGLSLFCAVAFAAPGAAGPTGDGAPERPAVPDARASASTAQAEIEEPADWREILPGLTGVAGPRRRLVRRRCRRAPGRRHRRPFPRRQRDRRNPATVGGAARARDRLRVLLRRRLPAPRGIQRGHRGFLLLTDYRRWSLSDPPVRCTSGGRGRERRLSPGRRSECGPRERGWKRARPGEKGSLPAGRHAGRASAARSGR